VTPVFPVTIVDQVHEVLRTRHVEHLAALERDVLLPPRSLPLLLVDYLTGEGIRTARDKPGEGALALVGIFGTTTEPNDNREDAMDFVWTMAMEVITRGVDRGDTIRKRDWYALTALECVMQHRPYGPASTMRLVDADLDAGALEEGSAETLAVARFMWDVEVPNTIRLVPRYTDPPTDPYDVPESFPSPPNVVRTNVIKEPLQ
jgi:hypothetical protein